MSRLGEELIEVTATCWLWRGYLDRNGYGIWAGKLVHRVAYEDWVGPIPLGLELDHLCRVRNCVYPDHLEPVTHAENMRRAAQAHTHCKQGHLYTAESTFTNASGYRECRLCAGQAKARWQRQKRGSGPGRANWTECARGLHALEGPNLIVRPNGARACRACRNERQRERRAGG